VMTIGPDNLGNGATIQERYGGQPGGYRGGRRESNPGDGDLLPRNGVAPSLESDTDMSSVRSLPALEFDGLAEPVYAPPAAWIDGGTLADHPLLRGLLLELPPKGSVPPPGWLDRWFEAARSILELLYLQESARV
jgi:hypothetical protein